LETLTSDFSPSISVQPGAPPALPKSPLPNDWKSGHEIRPDWKDLRKKYREGCGRYDVRPRDLAIVCQQPWRVDGSWRVVGYNKGILDGHRQHASILKLLEY
jgi:hypothetical protein